MWKKEKLIASLYITSTANNEFSNERNRIVALLDVTLCSFADRPGDSIVRVQYSVTWEKMAQV